MQQKNRQQKLPRTPGRAADWQNACEKSFCQSTVERLLATSLSTIALEPCANEVTPANRLDRAL